MAATNTAWQVKAGEFVFSLDQELIDKADMITQSPGHLNLLHNNRSVNVKVLEALPGSKHIRLEVEGEPFDVEIKDELDLLLDKMGYSAASGKHIKEIKAPMPGLVLEIAVADGQDVNEGDKILILEAMKMENSIMIHANATIKRVAVTPGQAVDKGQVLVELA